MNKNIYYGTTWIPEGWNKEEWHEVWRKLWLLSKQDIKTLAEKLGTYFVDKKFQEKQATKGDFIEIIDDGVDKSALLAELDKLIAKRDQMINKKNQNKWTYKEFTDFREKKLNKLSYNELIYLFGLFAQKFVSEQEFIFVNEKDLNKDDICNILEQYAKKEKLKKEAEKLLQSHKL